MPIGLPSFRRFLPAQLGVLQVLDRTAKSDAPRLGRGESCLDALGDRPTLFLGGHRHDADCQPICVRHIRRRERDAGALYAISHRALVEVARWETAMHLLLAAIAAAHPGLTLSNTNRNRLRRGFSLCWIGLHQPIIDMIRIGESLSHW